MVAWKHDVYNIDDTKETKITKKQAHLIEISEILRIQKTRIQTGDQLTQLFHGIKIHITTPRKKFITLYLRWFFRGAEFPEED